MEAIIYNTQHLISHEVFPERISPNVILSPKVKLFGITFKEEFYVYDGMRLNELPSGFYIEKTDDRKVIWESPCVEITFLDRMTAGIWFNDSSDQVRFLYNLQQAIYSNKPCLLSINDQNDYHFQFNYKKQNHEKEKN